MLTGGCFCGYVRYETSAQPTEETNCHCAICRRVSGAPFVAWFSVPKSAWRLVAGVPSTFASSQVATRSFCPRCGTPLTFEHVAFPNTVDITTCSLDDPEEVAPKDHTYIRSRLSWVELADGLPQHMEARDG